MPVIPIVLTPATGGKDFKTPKFIFIFQPHWHYNILHMVNVIWTHDFYGDIILYFHHECDIYNTKVCNTVSAQVLKVCMTPGPNMQSLFIVATDIMIVLLE